MDPLALHISLCNEPSLVLGDVPELILLDLEDPF
jgi:hypothetical protein